MARLDKLIWGDDRDPRDELRALFPAQDADADALAEAKRWGREIVAAAGVDPADELGTIRALRDAEPKLSLKPATYLAAQLAR